jgi:hypothetical protein
MLFSQTIGAAIAGRYWFICLDCSSAAPGHRFAIPAARILGSF